MNSLPKHLLFLDMRRNLQYCTRILIMFIMPNINATHVCLNINVIQLIEISILVIVAFKVASQKRTNHLIRALYKLVGNTAIYLKPCVGGPTYYCCSYVYFCSQFVILNVGTTSCKQFFDQYSVLFWLVICVWSPSRSWHFHKYKGLPNCISVLAIFFPDPFWIPLCECIRRKIAVSSTIQLDVSFSIQLCGRYL